MNLPIAQHILIKLGNPKEVGFSFSFSIIIIYEAKTEVHNSIYQESCDIHAVQCISKGKAKSINQ